MSRHRIGRALIPLIGALSVLAIFSSSALASGAPVVTTGTPDGFTLNGAVIHGTVNPNGLTTTYKIEYGTILPYNKSTESFTVSGTGEAPVAVETEILGLNARTTYHYRISATNSKGTTQSADALLETQVDWKVEGTRVSELPLVKFTDEYKGGATEGGYVEFNGPVLGGFGRIYCKQSTAVSGILGVEYSGLNFNNKCVAEQNGVPMKNCVPSGITLNLDGEFAMTAPTVVNMGSELCPWGEKASFKDGAFNVPNQLEATKYEPFLHAWVTGFSGVKKWEMVWSGGNVSVHNNWTLSAPNSGKKFGIS